MKFTAVNSGTSAVFRWLEKPNRQMLIFIIWICLSCGYIHYWSSQMGNKLGIYLNKTTHGDILSEAITSIRNVPPLPYIFGTDVNGPKYYKKSGCAQFPTLYDLEFNNIYWQTLRTCNGTFYFYGAYFDDRERVSKGPTLRILSMMDRIEPTVKTYCQIWFQGEQKPVFSRMQGYRFMWNRKWGNFKQNILQPYLLSCVVPRSHFGQVPDSVSVVEHRCDSAKNNLRVLYSEPRKKENFAVCVKGLDYLNDDLSIRLVEWIELLGILGVGKIYFYEFSVHPNISKVLRYYEQTGKIDVTPITLPGNQPNEPISRNIYLHKKVVHKRQNELIPYNDCLYRNIYNYHFIALLDIDEIIMSRTGLNWKELIMGIRKNATPSKKPVASYCFRNVYFFDDIKSELQDLVGTPNYMHMLQHVHRSRNHTAAGRFEKCFHDPEIVSSLHNHFATSCLTGHCKRYPVLTDIAQMQHYRADCARGVKDCSGQYRSSTILDPTIWHYRVELKLRAEKVLRELRFLI